MQKKLLVVVLGTLFALPAFADTAPAAPAAPAAPTLSAVLDASGLAVTGYLDVGFTNLDTTGEFINKTPTRVFDAPQASPNHNFSSFNLNQAAITVTKAPKEGFGGVINLTAGQDASVIASTGAGAGTSTFDVTQAYASYTGGPLTVIVGKFTTLAGAEVIASSADTNYSRSILFGTVPFTHTGVRATYAATDTVSVILGVNNGWDQVADTNSDKTVEVGFTAAPSKMFSLAGVYYGGNETTSTSPTYTNGNRQLFNLVGTLNATDALSFVLEFDSGSQANTALASGSTGTGTWQGVAGYINYAFNEKWRASLRSEQLQDKDGVLKAYVGTTGQTLSETTLTLAYMPTASVELRGEVRADSSNQSVFSSTSGTGKSNQNSVGLEALYKF